MTVRWTLQAASDLEQMCDYIQKESAEAALATARRVYRRIEALRRYPYRGRAGRVPGTRELVLAPLPYVGVYEVAVDAIVVSRILHGARRWP